MINSGENSIRYWPRNEENKREKKMKERKGTKMDEIWNSWTKVSSLEVEQGNGTKDQIKRPQ